MTSGTSYSPPPAFGRFRLLHQVGAGVLGPVFRTHDPDEDRLVAVKVFTLDLTPEQAEQLADELRRLTSIDLPPSHLAVPIDAGVEETVAYLAQQYVTGESLDAAIRQYGPAPMPDAARLISHVAEALDGAARVGVFHGALHPRDILVTPGETHLTGLGVASALERVGYPAPIRRPYAAPEREAGRPWGAAADVFSLAAIAHEVITGRRALPGTEVPLPGLDELKGSETAALREVLEHALDVDPERRPGSAADFAAAFAAALGVQAGAGGARPRRRPRAKAAPKLPGLDEPLLAPPAPEGVADAPPVPPALAEAREPDRVEAPSPPVSVPAPGPSFADELREAFDALPAEAPPTESRGPDDAAAEQVLLPDEGALPEPPAPRRAEVDDLRQSLPDTSSPEGRDAQRTPPSEDRAIAASADLQALSEELERFEPPPPEPPHLERPTGRTRRPPVDRDSLADDLREPGTLVAEPPVPRALDPGASPRPATLTRHAEPYRPVAPRERRGVVPVIIGVAAGLIAGLAIGYWFGARAIGTALPSSAQATAGAPAATVPSTPAAGPAAPAAPPVRRPAEAASPAVPALPVTRPAETASPAVATPPASVPTVQAGTIHVRSTPDRADVFLDGDRLGVTPRNVTDLPFGTYTVRVTRPGYVAQERTVTLDERARDIRVSFTLKRAGRPSARPVPAPSPRSAAPSPALRPSVVAGAIDVETRPPGARVRLDGKDVGVSPLVLGAVTVGSHTVSLELPGHRPWTTTITVKAGERVRVAASLERQPSR